MRTRIEPYRIKAVEPLPLTTRAERERALDAAGWNLFRLPARLVTIDLLTDSGVVAMSARQWGAMLQADESYAGADRFARFEAAVREVTGFAEVIPAHQGRAAERLLFEAMVRPGDVVPGNTHFDTTRANLERLGARPLDLPVPMALEPASEAPFKGNLQIEALEDLLHVRRPPLVLMTLTSNSTGGQPVSLDNMRAVRRLCTAHGVPLFIDAARFAENAWLARERDPRLGSLAPAEVARAFFDLSDGCVMSAKKDGLVSIGGFLALRSRPLAQRVRRAMVVTEGFPTYGGLAGRDLTPWPSASRRSSTPPIWRTASGRSARSRSAWTRPACPSCARPAATASTWTAAPSRRTWTRSTCPARPSRASCTSMRA